MNVQDKLVKGLNAFLVLGLLINVYVIWRFERDRKPVYHYEVVTNVIHTVSDTLQTSPTSVVPRGTTYHLPLHFFRLNGRWLAQWGCEYLSAQSPTPWGRVKRVYPDRLLLDDGSFVLSYDDVSASERPKIKDQIVPDQKTNDHLHKSEANREMFHVEQNRFKPISQGRTKKRQLRFALARVRPPTPNHCQRKNEVFERSGKHVANTLRGFVYNDC